MKTTHLLFLFITAFLIGALIGVARAQPDVGQDQWTNQDTMRAIENQQQILLQQRAIDESRRNESMNQLRENIYNQQILNEQRNQTNELRRMNRGF